MALSSLPNRPLKERELRAIGRSIEDSAPMVVRPDPDGSDIYAAVFVEENHVTAVVCEDDGWRVLDRHDRPHPPPAFEEQFRDWAQQYPDLVALC
jgi:hypothetical protein